MPIPLTLESLRQLPLPVLQDGSKETRGTVLVLGGSAELPGAALLAGVAALRAGAGRLRIATGRSVAPGLALALPEARVVGLPETEAGALDPASARATLAELAASCDALVAGPGLGAGDAPLALTLPLLTRAAAPGFVLDAGAIVALAPHANEVRRGGARMVLTPHAGEMAQLLGIDRATVEADPRAAAHRASQAWAATVVMKGAQTWVVDEEGGEWFYPGGGIGLATSGSGDVLSGIIGGLLARGADPRTAACWGVTLHGEAGRRLARTIGPVGFLAREIPDEVPAILRDADETAA